MIRRTRRHFGPQDSETLLTAIADCRSAIIKATAIAPISGDIYKSCGAVLKEIDGLAAVLTGEHQYFFPNRYQLNPFQRWT